MNRLKPAKLIQHFLLLHSTHFLSDGQQEAIRLMANCITTGNFPKTPKRCRGKIRSQNSVWLGHGSKIQALTDCIPGTLFAAGKGRH